MAPTGWPPRPTGALEAAPRGSGRQLVALRGVVAATSDVALLRGWLAGVVPAGATIDADVRWRIVTRLAALGALDADEIAAELAADHSTEGAQHAARARARAAGRRRRSRRRGSC